MLARKRTINSKNLIGLFLQNVEQGWPSIWRAQAAYNIVRKIAYIKTSPTCSRDGAAALPKGPFQIQGKCHFVRALSSCWLVQRSWSCINTDLPHFFFVTFSPNSPAAFSPFDRPLFGIIRKCLKVSFLLNYCIIHFICVWILAQHNIRWWLL